MSSNPTGHYSPLYRRPTTSYHTQVNRWTVDNSESRFHSLVSQSPKRSILKGNNVAETPLRYNSTLFLHEQEQRQERLNQRRVSFAKDAHLRVFSQDDTPDVTSRSIQNLIDEQAPSYLGNDILNSPTMTSYPISRLSASPSATDQRKRRPDLFGSPPGSSRSPKRRFGGQPPSLLNRVLSDTVNDEEEEGSGGGGGGGGGDNSDLMQYLEIPQSKTTRRNIFDDDDEEEEEVEEQDQQLVREERIEPPRQFDLAEEIDDQSFEDDDMMITQTVPPQQQQNDQTLYEDDMIITQVIEPIQSPVQQQQQQDDDDMIITQIISPQNPFAATEEEESSLSLLDQDAMHITQEIPPFNIASPIRRRSITPLQQRPRTPPSQYRFPTTASPLHNRFASPVRRNIPTPVRAATEARLQQLQQSPYSPNRQFYIHNLQSPVRPQLSRRASSVISDRIIALQDEEQDAFEEEEQEQQDNLLLDNSMPLAEFLHLVGVTFPDDPPARELRRRSAHLFDYGTSTIAQQAYAAAYILPEIDLYTKACNEMNEFVRHSQDTIRRVDQEVSQANPQLFTQYRESRVMTRRKIEQRMQDMKSYARNKSLLEWYEWWNPQLESFIDLLQRNNETIQQDTQITHIAEKRLQAKLPTAYQYKSELERRRAIAIERERQYNMIDHEQLAIYKREIDNQRKVLKEFQATKDHLESDEFELLEKENELMHQLSELQQSIKNAESTILENQFTSVRELIEAKQEFELGERTRQWNLKQLNDRFVEMNIHKDINIVIDKEKLATQQPDAVLTRMLESRDRKFGPIAELLHGLKVETSNKWDLDEIMQDIYAYWNRVLMIKREIELIQRRYWVVLKALEGITDPADMGFSCEVCLFSYAGNTKITASFQVKSRDVFDYPTIDFSTWDLKIHFGAVTYDELRPVFEQELAEDGMCNMAETLKRILEKVAIPQ